MESEGEHDLTQKRRGEVLIPRHGDDLCLPVLL